MLVELDEVIKIIKDYRDSDKIDSIVTKMVLTMTMNIIKMKVRGGQFEPPVRQPIIEINLNWHPEMNITPMWKKNDFNAICL